MAAKFLLGFGKLGERGDYSIPARGDWPVTKKTEARAFAPAPVVGRAC